MVQSADRAYYVQQSRYLAPSNLPPPILGTRSAMGGTFRYRGGDSKGAHNGRGERGPAFARILDLEKNL